MAGPQVQGLVLKRGVHPDQVGCQDRLNGQDRQQRQRDERRPPRTPLRPAAGALATTGSAGRASESSSRSPAACPSACLSAAATAASAAAVSATATEVMVARAAEASATPPWCRTGIWWHALLAHSRSDPPGNRAI